MYGLAMDSLSRLHGYVGLSEHLLVAYAISRGVEIPCLTCPTWSISFRTKFLFTCPGTSLKKVNA